MTSSQVNQPMTHAAESAEIEKLRRDRTWRLSAIELPRLRLAGTFLLSLAVWVNNRYLVPTTSLDGWIITTIVLFAWAIVSWGLLVLFLRREPPVDLTLPALAGDLLFWTFAIYHSGAERSWLFFILFLRVADQVQTTFRRALAFALAGAGCYATMLAWIRVVDGRPIAGTAALAKLLFILFAGVYISLAARTAERRRARLTESVRMSRELIQRLEEAHAHAEEASAAKSEFVANMSHEMRTPLQGVVGMLQLAIDDERSEEIRRRLETARYSAETLMAMIEDVLDFSRIEARKLELEPVYFPLRKFMAETMKSLGTAAASKNLILSYVVAQGIADSVWGDPVRLRQILVNLVGNAIKFTHEGEIAVSVLQSDGRVRFEVCDTGVGIAPTLRQRIFEPFTQGDSSHGRRHGGAGLGLSIVVRLLEAMGGTVDVRSDEGKGSVFFFEIPLSADAVGAASQRQPWESSLAGRSIVVVEPAELSRGAIAEILRSRGVFASAFARAADVPDGRFACAVTADPSLPVDPKVVIVSPLQEGEHPFRVTRPVAERELIDAIGQALGVGEPLVEYTLKPMLRAPGPLRILLVDDNAINREVLAEILRRLGHDVTIAVDGEEALTKLAQAAFDVVLMDVQLPGVDGIEVTRRLRTEGRTTPIIGVTAHSSRQDRDRCVAAGMDAVLTKPVGATQLAKAIADISRGDTLVSAVGGNPKVLKAVRDAFDRQTPMLLDAIHKAIEHGDADSLRRNVHTLKGSLSYFPGRAAAAALDVERAARSGDLDRAAALLPALEREIDRLSAELARTMP